MLERFEKFSSTISDISRYWHKIASEEMEKYGLKGAHAVYLTTLYHYPEGLNAMSLCKMCGKDKADVSRMMSIIEKKNLVTKEDIHRVSYRGKFTLTEEGKKAAEIIGKRASLAVEMASQGVTEEEREIFYKVLETITANLEKISKEGLPSDQI